MACAAKEHVRPAFRTVPRHLATSRTLTARRAIFNRKPWRMFAAHFDCGPLTNTSALVYRVASGANRHTEVRENRTRSRRCKRLQRFMKPSRASGGEGETKV
jgi:hypothetical protein